MNTCDTCKHWKMRGWRNDTTDNPNDSQCWEDDDSPQMVCAQPKLQKFVKPLIDGASVCDGSYYMAMLYTGPKFGCIHHEPK